MTSSFGTFGLIHLWPLGISPPGTAQFCEASHLRHSPWLCTGKRQSFHSKHRSLRNNTARSQSSQVNLELAQIGDATSSLFFLQPLHTKSPLVSVADSHISNLSPFRAYSSILSGCRYCFLQNHSLIFIYDAMKQLIPYSAQLTRHFDSCSSKHIRVSTRDSFPKSQRILFITISGSCPQIFASPFLGFHADLFTSKIPY